MSRYLYYFPHLLTLIGLALAVSALMAVFRGDFTWAARYSLLVLLIDRFDGTLARKFKVREKFPGTSGEVLDIITDLVGLTFVPMVLFWRSGLFPENLGPVLVIGASVTASWKYARKESFLAQGYSTGAPPIFFSLFIFYFLEASPVFAALYTVMLIVLVISPIKYPITCLVTTHWQPGFKSLTNWLTALFFVPVFIMLKEAPAILYWILLANILVQLLVYPVLLYQGTIKPVFDRKY